MRGAAPGAAEAARYGPGSGAGRGHLWLQEGYALPASPPEPPHSLPLSPRCLLLISRIPFLPVSSPQTPPLSPHHLLSSLTPFRYPHIPSCCDPTSHCVIIPHPLLLLSHMPSRYHPCTHFHYPLIPPCYPRTCILAPTPPSPAGSPNRSSRGRGLLLPQPEGCILDTF